MSKMKEKFSKAWEKIKSVKHIEIIVAVLAVAVMLLVYFGTSCGSSEKSGIEPSGGEYDYYASTVKELERKLSEIEGVGDVSVLVNWSEISSETGSTVEGKFVKPEGVIIICEGGNNISVKVKLISSVASYFGIDENKITVLAKTNK